MGHVVGVDGCKFGWIAVSDEGTSLTYKLFASMKELLDFHRDADRILVDIPIGLPWRECATRPCDEMARKVLKHRHVCVFAAPSRSACHAQTKPEARRLNGEELGKSLSEQALGICGKVAEVDDLMTGQPNIRPPVREIHPEVCFWGLNGKAPLHEAKTTALGVQARLAVISRRLPQAPELVQRVLSDHRRVHVKADDVLDALAGYLTARAGPSALRVLQGVPAHDQRGLPMEMLYIE